MSNESFDFIHLSYSLDVATTCCVDDGELFTLVSEIGNAVEVAKHAFTTGIESGTVDSYDFWVESVCFIWSYTAPLAKLAVRRVVSQKLQPANHILRLLLHFIYHNSEVVCPVLLKQGGWCSSKAYLLLGV